MDSQLAWPHTTAQQCDRIHERPCRLIKACYQWWVSGEAQLCFHREFLHRDMALLLFSSCHTARVESYRPRKHILSIIFLLCAKWVRHEQNFLTNLEQFGLIHSRDFSILFLFSALLLLVLSWDLTTAGRLVMFHQSWSNHKCPQSADEPNELSFECS